MNQVLGFQPDLADIRRRHLQIFRQPGEDTLRVEAKFQERTEVLRWRLICFAGQTAARQFGDGIQFQGLELRALNLSRC